MSFFAGLEIASSAIRTQRQLITMIQHNIANASTPGYSRQTGSVQASNPFATPSMFSPTGPLQIGTGSQLVDVTRMRLETLEQAYRNETQVQANASATRSLMEQVETIFGEPGTSGFAESLNDFFEALSSLASQPDSLTHRNNLLQEANLLTGRLRTLNNDIQAVVSQINTQVNDRVTEINTLLDKIADLNKQIRLVRAAGDQANDLEDRRDATLVELSKLINIQVVKKSDGSSYVYNGGMFLVSDDTVKPLTTFIDVNGRRQVRFADGNAVSLTEGELAGIINARDVQIGLTTTAGSILNQLNTLATNIITEINNRHRNGYDLNNVTGSLFFSGTDLSTIGVAITDPRGVAASVATLTSTTNMNNLFRTINPTQDLSVGIASNDYATVPVAGTFTIDTGGGGVVFTYALTDSIDDIVNMINNNTTVGVTARFDTTSQKIVLARDTSENPPPGGGATITVTNGTSNFTNWTQLAGAVSTTGSAGDNTNINTIFNLSTQAVLGLTNQTFAVYYSNLVTQVGQTSSNAIRQDDAEKLVLQQLDKQRESNSGVNLDEEALSLIKAQQGFNASARALTALDEMLNRIINGMGRVGL